MSGSSAQLGLFPLPAAKDQRRAATISPDCVGTAITEGSANFLVNRRMNKSQQMRWELCAARRSMRAGPSFQPLRGRIMRRRKAWTRASASASGGSSSGSLCFRGFVTETTRAGFAMTAASCDLGVFCGGVRFGGLAVTIIFQLDPGNQTSITSAGSDD
jgi:hypothetical protein